MLVITADETPSMWLIVQLSVEGQTVHGEGLMMRYQFVVQQPVSVEVAAELSEMSVTAFPTGGTAVFGPMRDEADVWSTFAHIRSLGLSVVDVHPLPD